MREVTLERVIACESVEQDVAHSFGALIGDICEYMYEHYNHTQDCSICKYQPFCGQNGLDIIESIIQRMGENNKDIDFRVVSEREALES